MSYDGRIQCDARALPIASGTVQCVCTSPPYFGLRNYGHDGQIGMERTVEEYVDSLREVFLELWRVLKPDGVAWLNLGDSYCGSGMTGGTKSKEGSEKRQDRMFHGNRRDTLPGLKQKDLIGIPWRVAFALQADGWYLRSDIIWSKPNPMPESVTDRPTKAHEYIFLLAKGQWKSRVVKFSDLGSERFHSGCYVGGARPDFRSPFTGFCVSLATAIFETAQLQSNFSLPPFYAKEWQERLYYASGTLVSGLPEEQVLTASAACFLSAKTTSEEFVQQIDSFRLNLSNTNHFLVGGTNAVCSLSPAVYRDGNRSITVNNSGEICEFDFLHKQIVLRTSTTCNYYYDQAAIAEVSQWEDHNRFGNKNAEARNVEKLTGNMAEGADKKPFTRRLSGHMQGTQRNDGDRGRESEGGVAARGYRNKRSVWQVATSPYPEAHYATFPEEIPEICIKAGSRVGDFVLDPFAGSNTTGRVAERLSRRWIACDLGYQDLQQKRMANLQKVLV